MLRLGLSPPGSARPPMPRSFDRTDIKRARKFRDDGHILKEPAQRVHAVDQSNRHSWMQKIEWIDPNVTIACFFEQSSERPPEECCLIRLVGKLSFNPAIILLYRNLRVQHVWLCKIDCTSWLDHAVYVA